MPSRVNLEVSRNNGTKRLVHWDNLHGEDTIIRLDKNGVARRRQIDDLTGDVKWVKVNLVKVLRNMVRRT